VQFEAPEDSCFVVVRELLRKMQLTRRLALSKVEFFKILQSAPYFSKLAYSYLVGGRIPYPPPLVLGGTCNSI